MASSLNEEVVDRLDVLIRLQGQALTSHIDGQKERILFLHKAGLGPKLIAEIIGTSPNSVSVALSKARKAGEIE
ncbi:MAG: hypothetical protein ACTS1X_04055 [Parasphingopyxis sp.]|uniref:hypothetical protein n=1 Tax=Parasphingopyxis sp. TaxID=1920299 RepID=UPI003F9F3A87